MIQWEILTPVSVVLSWGGAAIALYLLWQRGRDETARNRRDIDKVDQAVFGADGYVRRSFHEVRDILQVLTLYKTTSEQGREYHEKRLAKLEETLAKMEGVIENVDKTLAIAIATQQRSVQ